MCNCTMPETSEDLAKAIRSNLENIRKMCKELKQRNYTVHFYDTTKSSSLDYMDYLPQKYFNPENFEFECSKVVKL